MNNSTGGHPAQGSAFNPDAACIIFIDIVTTHTTVALCTLDGKILASHEIPHGAEHDPHTVLPELCKISDRLLTDTEHGVPCAVSIAATTRVAESTGQIIGQGINFIDTANRYAFGTSEEYIGQALRNLNIAWDQVVLASKVYFNDGHLSKEAINYEIDGTLKRLDTDYLEEPYTAHELVGPLSRPEEKDLSGALAPTLKETTRN